MKDIQNARVKLLNGQYWSKNNKPRCKVTPISYKPIYPDSLSGQQAGFVPPPLPVIPVLDGLSL